MQVLQCPRCEMRFPSASELSDHLSVDHPDFRSTASSLENELLGACHCHHHGSGHARHDEPAPGDAA